MSAAACSRTGCGRPGRPGGYSNATTAAAAVTAATRGIGLGPSTWAAYESGGRKVSAKHLAAIESVFGPAPTTGVGAGRTAADTAALVAALTRQSAAIEALVDEMRASRTEMVSIAALTQFLATMKAEWFPEPPATPPSTVSRRVRGLPTWTR